jgi:5,10-methylenetetrahydrofolate reductase
MPTRMRRPFRERLASTPVVLEIVPPGRRASEKTVHAFVDRLRDAVLSLRNLDAINVPEVLDENHAGQPFYRDMDPREFAALLGGGLPVDPIANKVVAHVPSPTVLRRWIRESLERYRLRNFVLVGGNSSWVRYPGPSVIEANRILRTTTRGRDDVALGNITIPERDHEVDRLVEKTRAGCDFFSTQVLFEAEPMATVLRAYGRRCAAQRLKPATVLLSFAPVSDYADLEFLVWLGATVLPRTEEALLPPKTRTPGQASLEVARTLWSHLSAAAAQSKPPVPLGVNIEEVSAHNFDLAVQMAREFPAWADGGTSRASDV